MIGFSLVSFCDGILFSILRDRVFFRVFSGRVLFRFLSDRSFSRVLCPLFSVPRYCFIKKRASTFLIKNMLYFGALIVSTAYITHCHSSLLVTRSHLMLLVVIRCHSLYHLLSPVVICCATRCHSMPFVVTRCTTGLYFQHRMEKRLFKFSWLNWITSRFLWEISKIKMFKTNR